MVWVLDSTPGQRRTRPLQLGLSLSDSEENVIVQSCAAASRTRCVQKHSRLWFLVGPIIADDEATTFDSTMPSIWSCIKKNVLLWCLDHVSSRGRKVPSNVRPAWMFSDEINDPESTAALKILGGQLEWGLVGVCWPDSMFVNPNMPVEAQYRIVRLPLEPQHLYIERVTGVPIVSRQMSRLEALLKQLKIPKLFDALVNIRGAGDSSLSGHLISMPPAAPPPLVSIKTEQRIIESTETALSRGSQRSSISDNIQTAIATLIDEYNEPRRDAEPVSMEVGPSPESGNDDDSDSTSDQDIEMVDPGGDSQQSERVLQENQIRQAIEQVSTLYRDMCDRRVKAQDRIEQERRETVRVVSEDFRTVVANIRSSVDKISAQTSIELAHMKDSLQRMQSLHENTATQSVESMSRLSSGMEQLEGLMNTNIERVQSIESRISTFTEMVNDEYAEPLRQLTQTVVGLALSDNVERAQFMQALEYFNAQQSQMFHRFDELANFVYNTSRQLTQFTTSTPREALDAKFADEIRNANKTLRDELDTLRRLVSDNVIATQQLSEAVSTDAAGKDVELQRLTANTNRVNKNMSSRLQALENSVENTGRVIEQRLLDAETIDSNKARELCERLTRTEQAVRNFEAMFKSKEELYCLNVAESFEREAQALKMLTKEIGALRALYMGQETTSTNTYNDITTAIADLATSVTVSKTSLLDKIETYQKRVEVLYDRVNDEMTQKARQEAEQSLLEASEQIQTLGTIDVSGLKHQLAALDALVADLKRVVNEQEKQSGQLLGVIDDLRDDTLTNEMEVDTQAILVAKTIKRGNERIRITVDNAPNTYALTMLSGLSTALGAATPETSGTNSIQRIRRKAHKRLSLQSLDNEQDRQSKRLFTRQDMKYIGPAGEKK